MWRVVKRSPNSTWVMFWTAIDISPDGKRIATAVSPRAPAVWTFTGRRLFRLKDPNVFRRAFGSNQIISTIQFSPDGHLIATASHFDKPLRVYDRHNGRFVVDFPIKTNSLVWAGSGQLFAATPDNTVSCLDVSTGKITPVGLPNPSFHDLRCIALSPNDKFLAVCSGSRSPSLTFVDTKTHKRIGNKISHSHHTVSSMAISANYDILLNGKDILHGHKEIDGSVILRNPCGGLLSIYVTNDTSRGREALHTRNPKGGPEDVIQSHREVGTSSDGTIENLRNEPDRSQRGSNNLEEAVLTHEEDSTNLERSIHGLRIQSMESQRAARHANYNLNETAVSPREHLPSQMSSTGISVDFRVHQQKYLCEALYNEGRIMDAALLLLEIIGIISQDADADEVIVHWVSEFTSKCTESLEKIGDLASSAGKHEEALVAYSTALSLGFSTSGDLLTKWARKISVRQSMGEVLGVVAKFKFARFDIYRAICDALEGDGRIRDAVEYFWQMHRELRADVRNQDERKRWQYSFRWRCIKKLEKFGDDAMASENYDQAVDHFSILLSLEPYNRTEVQVKLSKAQGSIKLLEDALRDADEIIGIDPSLYQGYEMRHGALHMAKRYAEAVEAFDTMLSKLDASPDESIRELRQRYVDVRPTIRRIVEQTIRPMPRVLIDTTTGRLCDKRQLAEAFEVQPIYAELVSSMITELDHTRISREVKKFYQYVTFSHKWQNDEPLLQKVEHITVYKLEVSPANIKLQSFCTLVQSLGFRWAWSDTCCVDKSNHIVLQESLVAMFSWYRGSSLTIVHLLGVSSESQEPGDLEESIWNTRAWTYQEYVASKVVLFFTEDWKPYLGLTLANHKEAPEVVLEMENVSGFSDRELAILQPGLERAREKLCLASTRQTTLVEDAAYSLLGIFNISIPVIYGEGNRAVGRLLEHILTGSGDVTILAWTGTPGGYNSCLPADLGVYQQVVPPHVPPVIEETRLNRVTTELRSSLTDLSVVLQLYDRLHELPSPFIAANRLRLPGIVFRLTKFVHASGPNPETHLHVYRAKMWVFGDIEIATTDDLTGMNVLYLAHPWIRPLLDQEFSDRETIGTTETTEDRTTQALRLVVRLSLPFGALLFKPLSRIEYRRVAADSLIMVQIRNEVPLTHLVDNIRTIEVQ